MRDRDPNHGWSEPQPPTSAPGAPQLPALRVTLPLRGAKAEVSRARGLWALGPSAPLDAIARGESFTPTRSARTPPVARPWGNPGWRDRYPGTRCHECSNEHARRIRFHMIRPRGPLARGHSSPEHRLREAPVRGRPSHHLTCVVRWDRRPGRAASRDRSRKRSRSAAPEVPSIDGPRS
jgi:hypothetical protein